MDKKLVKSGIIAIIIIGAIVGVYLWKDLKSRPAFATAEVKRGNIQNVIKLTGKVEPQEASDMGFEATGRIVEIAHKTGDTVNQGDILARLDDSSAQASYQQAQSLLKSAQAILDQDKQLVNREQYKLKSMEKTGSNHEDKESQRNQIEAQKALVSSQEDQVQATTDNVTNMKAQLDNTIMRAPFSGVIAHENSQAGEVYVVGMSPPILTLANNQAWEVDVNVSQADVSNIKPDQIAQITFPNDPATVHPAKVTKVDPVETDVNDVSNYKVTLDLTDGTGGLQSGIDANVAFIIGSKENVLLVPEKAVFSENNQKFVYVSRDGLMEKREVETGLDNPNSAVEITSGLADGDIIFVTTNQ